MVKKAQTLQSEENVLQEGAAAQEQQEPEVEVEKTEEAPKKAEEDPAKEEPTQEEPTQEEPVQEQQPEPGCTVVVLAFSGTERLVQRVWNKHFRDDSGVKVIVGTFQEDGMSLKDVLEEVMVDPEMEKTVIVVPANLVPVAAVTLNDLLVARVDVNKGQQRFWGRVPVTFDKDILVDFLPEHEDDSDEDFVKEYLKLQDVRPIEVSHSFGNFFTKVLRGNPCMNVVIEALVRKRFIYANPTGWSAITGLLEKTLAE